VRFENINKYNNSVLIINKYGNNKAEKIDKQTFELNRYNKNNITVEGLLAGKKEKKGGKGEKRKKEGKKNNRR
jgi:hypothetical protein